MRLLPPLVILVAACCLVGTSAFVPSVGRTWTTACFAWQVSIDLPNSEMTANVQLDPILGDNNSELVTVRYQIPFDLNVAPQQGLAVCTKDGPGGEKVGDVLRYASQWTLGLPQGEGLVSTAAAFGGGLSWQPSLFNVAKAKAWEQVVEALVSNTPDRTDEVVLLFERPLESS